MLTTCPNCQKHYLEEKDLGNLGLVYDCQGCGAEFSYAELLKIIKEKTEIKLDNLIKVKEFLSYPEYTKYLEYILVTQFFVPSEVVIDKPQFVVPKVRRQYKTNLYLLEGKVVDYDTLKNTPGFKGTHYHAEVVLQEVWENWGDDGHTDYKLVGYRFTK